MIFVVSGPSGAGKSTLCSRLLEEDDSLSLSISYTTRAPRGAEQDGVHYHFVERSRFTAMADAGEFVEWAVVHDNLYGTSRAATDAVVEQGRAVLFDVDYQGAAALRRAYPEAVTTIVLPPNMAILEARLRGRGTDAPDVIARRMRNARAEIASAPEFGYVIVNDDVDASFVALHSILVASRHRTRAVWPSAARALGVSE
ncbi:MAG: guanylate kinase [Myxococcales bacterium]|nr:guanylate kinase [Myxococcales bacterium]